MPKAYGGTRGAMPGTAEYKNRQSEVDTLRQSGKYSSVEFFENSGGYLAVEHSERKHKPEEIEAATYLAEAGYKVTLVDEHGKAKTPDGKVYTFTYEQKTPQKQGTTEAAESVRKCMTHAVSKSADIALIYDKHENYHRADIEAGISLFENGNERLNPNPYRFKKIIVVDKGGRVYEHVHN